MNPNELVLSRKQVESFLQSDAPMNFWVGAVRSGKTYISLLKFIDFVRNGPKGDFAIVGQSLQAIKRNILGPLKQMLGHHFDYFLGRAEGRLWGRMIHLIGATDERAEAKIRGCTLAGAYVDEVTILPEAVFMMLRSRLSVPGAKLFGATNPDSPFHWLKVNFLDRESQNGYKHWDFNLDDNPSLDETFKDNLKRDYQGLWYKRLIEGKWALAEGAIFDFFDESVHTIGYPPGRADKYFVGADYGTSNCFAMVMIGYSERTYPNIWLEKEYKWDAKKMLRQKTDSEYAEDMKKFLSGYNVEMIYLDPSAVSFRVELRTQGFNRVLEGNNEVLDGIRFHAKLLNNGTFKIMNTCRETLKEYMAYRWDETLSLRKGVDVPMKENDHLMDAIRYVLFTEWFNKEGKRWSEEDFRRLRKEATGEGDEPELGKFFDNKLW